MSGSTPQLPIILYHYPYSPYARRIIWYLRLRGISYMECIQPPTLSRPDLKTHLSLTHRRIPLLAAGRDLYLDTRLILRKLETMPDLSSPPLGATAAQGHGPEGGEVLQRLLSVLTTGTDLFFQAVRLLPGGLPLMRDGGFRRDREDFFYGGKDGQPATPSSHSMMMEQGEDEDGGGDGDRDVNDKKKQDDKKEQKKQKQPREDIVATATRAQALHAIHTAMSLLETTLLADGRPWILPGQQGPTLADIEAVWIFHWLIGLPGHALELHSDFGSASEGTGYVSTRDRFPRVYAWVDRFQQAVSAAKANVDVRGITGEEAAAFLKGEVEGTGYAEDEAEVDATEPVVRVFGLEKGAMIEVWPTDSGAGHRDRGRLVGIGAEEVVWETEAGVRVHAPRLGFRVQPAVG